MKKTVTVIIALLSVIAMIVLLLPACNTQTPDEPDEPEAKVFKLGIILPLTGPVALWGIPFRNGAALVTEMINEEGGLQIGDDRYIIELYEEDDNFTAEAAASASHALVERYDVDLIYGSIGPDPVLAAQEISEPAQIITLHACATDNSMIGRDYSFRGYLSYYETYPGMMSYVDETYGVSKIALLGVNAENSWYGHDLVEQFAPKIGWTVVYNECYESGTQDFTPFLVNALAEEPEVFFNTSSPNSDWALIIKQARELGYTGLFMESHPPSIAELIPIAGAEAVEGLIGVGDLTSGPMISQATQDFVDRYISEYGEWHPEAFVLAPSLAAIFMAIEEAGTLDSNAIIEVLESGKEWQTITGVSGVFNMEGKYGKPRQWVCPQYVRVVENGEDKAVYEIPVEDIIHGWD